MNPKFDPKHFDAIIFDLGGVLLNIDYQLSKCSFEKLGIQDFDLHFSQLAQSHLFDNFEKGTISAQDFRVALKKEGGLDCNDSEIDQAWNAMLLDFPIHRIDFLKSLSSKLPLFLFSNTNEIHIHEFTRRMKHEQLLSRFSNSFEKIYYSFQLGQRKPEPHGFIHILEENGLKASNTLFIDDSEQHVEGARKVGIQSVLLKPNLDVIELFNHE